jgi:adenosylmethionine-8-amino-7-oxononanoate aminotransferase
MSRFWHPFADMHVVATNEVVMERADGVRIWDTAGRSYLDATAGLWYCNVGFGRAEIADAAADQMKRLPAYSTFGVYATKPTIELAERLAAIAPIDDAVVFFTSGGSESVDTAAKLARRYWDVVGKPERRIIVSREFSYHGMAAFGTSLAGMPANRAGYGGPLVEAVEYVPWDDTAALEALLADHGEQVAAFIGEPVIGAGGVIPPSEGYWAEINRICKAHGILLIADEVITGFGRTGAMFGTTTYGLAPDMITFAKGVTSGYVPFGGVFVGPRVAAPFWKDPTGAIFRHGYTYSGHAAGAAAAQANLDIIEREDLVGRVQRLTPALQTSLEELLDHPLVAEVRVAGLTGAVELKEEVVKDGPAPVDRVVVSAREHGVLTRNLRGRALQISPPFVITEGELNEMTRGIRAALDELAAVGAR